MNTGRGIVYVVFGKSYENMAMHTIRLSGRQTRLPICVLTNIPEHERSSGWARLKNVDVRYVDLPDAKNRVPKIQLHRYTPFKQTLYIDCDAVIMRSDVERAFAALETADIALAPRFFWNPAAEIPEVYVRAFRLLGVRLPVDAWHGAIFAFDKDNPAACALFDLWHDNWRITGCYRDLPALVAAVKLLTAAGKLRVAKLPPDFFGLKNPNTLTVWHPQPGKPEEFMKRFRIPSWEPWNPGRQRYERWNLVKENCELSADRELPAAAAQPKELCITAYAFGDYAEYAPILAYSALWSCPGATIKLFFAGAMPQGVADALNYLRRQLSPNIVTVENYQPPVRASAAQDPGKQAGKCVRWLIPGTEFAGFEYVYMADIDFLIVPEQPGLLAQHKAIMAELGTPHSNPVRWSYKDRVSGLQMVRAEPYFAAIEPLAEKYRRGAAPIPAGNNEAFLYRLLESAGILPAARPVTRAEFDRLRPHHGYHIGLVRQCRTPQDYTELWTRNAPAAYPMITSPLFDKLLQFIRVPWVAESVRRMVNYIKQTAEPAGGTTDRPGKPAGRPGKPAGVAISSAHSVTVHKGREMRNRMERLHKRKLVLVPASRPVMTRAASLPVTPSAQPTPVRKAVPLTRHSGSVLQRRVPV